jgi:hypothetical protein
MNKFEVSDTSYALQNALQTPAGVPHAKKDVAFNEEPSTRWPSDDDILKCIISKMVGTIVVLSLDKLTLDCVSVPLQKEIQYSSIQSFVQLKLMRELRNCLKMDV